MTHPSARWRVFLTGLLLCLSYCTQANQRLIFDGPDSEPQAQFVQSLLEQAYADLGYDISYRPMPLARSFVEANAGRIDGLRARVAGVENQYQDLIPVPFPLLNFDLVVVGDRRHCGLCDVGSMKQVATIRGFLALDQYLQDKDYAFELKRYSTFSQILDLVEAGRVDGALLPASGLPKDLTKIYPHGIQYPLYQFPDFHYLHKRHKDLVQPLVARLKDLESSGFIDELRQRYGVDPIKAKAVELPKKITISGSAWTDYTKQDTDTYIRLLRDIFTPLNVEITFAIDSWQQAKADFYRGKTDALIGAYYSERGAGLASGSHIDYEYPIKAYGTDKKELDALIAGGIKGVACQQTGLDWHHYLPTSITPLEQDDLQDCFRLLDEGWVELLLEVDYHLTEAQRETYPSVQVLESLPMFVMFQDTPVGRALMRHFDREFRRLLLAGKGLDYYPSKSDFDYARLIIPEKE